MNVLEKILEEISEVEKEYVTGHKVLYALGATGMATEISGIIRSHMDEVVDMHGKRLIDANALDDEVTNFFLAITGNPKQTTVVRECKESFRRMIDEQPTVYANNGWIPVSEKLPEEDERYKGRKAIDVLVTTSNGRVTKVQRQSKYDYWCWGRIYGEPTAWQPLPEPYKAMEG